MDWIIRAVVFFFILFVAFLLLLEAIHVIAQRVRDWRDIRNGREWFVARDEWRVAQQLRPKTGNVERHR